MRVASAAAQPFLKSMSRLVGGDAIAEAIAFFQAFDGMEAGFRERASTVMRLLRSDDTGYVLITSPRREAVDEAIYFAHRLHENHLSVAAVVTNRVHPLFLDAGPTDRPGGDRTSPRVGGAADGPVGALRANLALLHRAALSERRALAPLTEAISGPSADAGAPRQSLPAAEASVPLLDEDVHDLPGLGTVANHLLGLHPGGLLR
jgi:anion-transporting  ArsA/GET3 family ATPase